MTDYNAPLRDIRFAMDELWGYSQLYAELLGEDVVSPDLVSTICDEYAKFCSEVLHPLNRTADEVGCQWVDGAVTTPPGFIDAYSQYIEAGWPSLSCDPEYGGQGLPTSLALQLGEMTVAANTSFALYTGGLSGAIETLALFGSQDQRATYEKKLIEGTWNATMCLTEPHCGTDLGMLKSKAEPQADGSHLITGTKIFITGGEHDLTENIIHLVLARLPDAPAGTKGISLFVVPKLEPQADGELKPNGVSCGSIEHKMGIKGSATCVMHFDGSRGIMLGEANRGLSTMFKFINASRVRAAFQGVAHAELGFQKSLAYARDRLQMRSLAGVQNPEGPADPIIVHPDVRRMLLTQKALVEGSRAMLLYLAKQLDISERSPDAEVRSKAEKRLDLLTPIAKGFATEAGCECANHALQCFGGHGYVREWGVEQNVRDARIATLYEGTTGIQALDLIGRKVLADGGAELKRYCAEIEQFCQAEPDSPYASKLAGLTKEWLDLAQEIGQRSMSDPTETGSASYNFLMYSGYVCLAYQWARAERVAASALYVGAGEADFYEAKRQTARFYFEQILPRTRTCVEAISYGGESLMALRAEHFAF